MSWIPEVFVLWHPDSTIGEFLAQKIYDWLRPAPGVGLQVYYRCLPAPGSPPGTLPLPLPGDVEKPSSSKMSNVQIVVPLIDEHMIASPAWRNWLAMLRNRSDSRVVWPVALHPSAYNAPKGIRELNFLRPTSKAGASASDPTAREVMSRSLLRQLTEALGRLMLGGDGAVLTEQLAGTRPKVRIFLSHAKADGPGPARRIRDYIYGHTQIAAFFDENDIPYASGFAQVLERDANPQNGMTAAMIAIKSAAYASRPWCRWELSRFRKPVPIDSDVDTATRWRLHPVLVVEAMDGGVSSVGIPELGNAPVVRWSDSIPDLEESIVTQLLRDAVLGAYHDAMGRTLTGDRDRLVLNWQPDPTTLLSIPRVRASHAAPLDVVYPGRGLPGLELDILYGLFPNVTFLSFDEATS
jgi:hypothetical protein